jgi:hypothetical protein
MLFAVWSAFELDSLSVSYGRLFCHPIGQWLTLSLYPVLQLDPTSVSRSRPCAPSLAPPLTPLTTPPRRPEHLAEVDAFFLARLAVPHLGMLFFHYFGALAWANLTPCLFAPIEHGTTFSSYSSLITKYDNDHYATKLPAANKVYAAAVKVVDDGREQEEAKLTKRAATEPGQIAPVWAYFEYLNW